MLKKIICPICWALDEVEPQLCSTTFNLENRIRRKHRDYKGPKEVNEKQFNGKNLLYTRTWRQNNKKKSNLDDSDAYDDEYNVSLREAQQQQLQSSDSTNQSTATDSALTPAHSHIDADENGILNQRDNNTATAACQNNSADDFDLLNLSDRQSNGSERVNSDDQEQNNIVRNLNELSANTGTRNSHGETEAHPIILVSTKTQPLIKNIWNRQCMRATKDVSDSRKQISYSDSSTLSIVSITQKRRAAPQLQPAPKRLKTHCTNGTNALNQSDQPDHPLIGTNPQIEKSYYRLTKATQNVRSQDVLRLSLEMVKAKWKEGSKYSYLREQLQSIRQDLIVRFISVLFLV